MFRRIDGSHTRWLAAVAFAAATALVLGAWTTSTTPAANPRELVAMTGYEIVTAATEASRYDVQSVSARCSAGKKVLGGGASILGSDGVAIFWNGPARTTGTGSWAAAAQEIASSARRWSLEVYAICAHIGIAKGGE